MTASQHPDEPLTDPAEPARPDADPEPDAEPSGEAVAEAAAGPDGLAEPGQRLLARIVDTLIVGLPVIVVVRELVSGSRVDVVAPPAVAGCLLVYDAVQLAVWGRTLGKRFAGIEVVTATGPRRARLGILRSIARAAVYALPVAVRPVPVLGLLAGVFWVVNAGLLYEGAGRQAGHDRLLNTQVRKRPRSSPPE
ncbi:MULTISPECIES: RDD family protein [Actinomadura]|uniref:RDD family protein n=1 Tax=Actinomadura litoris TaxID=2678616 RepID=A0A7K1KUH5_9ACTN|nr:MULTISPECIES: RDD family protein [Actinomadura]MBT2207610.1 RDD family protein [Actinomadura sp. NEAU-AAG7]MUN35596.1 RDD family protein [Actinomadura litoris]